MSLITPDFGLLFWMVIIFGAVFFILARFGFPLITSMVQKRSDHIADSLEAARQARQSLECTAREQQEILSRTGAEQARLLKEAAQERENMIAQARVRAQEEAAAIIAQARAEIASERENAVRQIRSEVALISVEVARKIMCETLEDTSAQAALADRLLEEVTQNDYN